VGRRASPPVSPLLSRHRTAPWYCFVKVESVDRVIYSIFPRFNLEWKTRTCRNKKLHSLDSGHRGVYMGTP
jgi:hypothetical protein